MGVSVKHSMLAGCRRIRTGQTRIVYRFDGARIEVLEIAVGMRRDNGLTMPRQVTYDTAIAVRQWARCYPGFSVAHY